MSPDPNRTAEDHTRSSQTGESPPRVRGILETALYVKDPRQSADFYRRLFEFPTLLESERLITLDVSGKSVLLLFKAGTTTEPFATAGGIIPGHWGSGQTHFAFAVTADDLPAWRRRLTAKLVPIESEVNWPGGAASLYFRDPDAHLVELITEGFWRSY